MSGLHVCVEGSQGSELSSTPDFHVMKRLYYCHISIVLNTYMYIVLKIHICGNIGSQYCYNNIFQNLI